ncbi:hypothetical protein D3C71_1972050 [compost metagenome]
MSVAFVQLDILVNLRSHEIPFIMLGIPAVYLNLGPAFFVRPQLLRLPAGIQTDNLIGCIQDIRG